MESVARPRWALYDSRCWLLGVDSKTTHNFTHANQELRHKSIFWSWSARFHTSPMAVDAFPPTGPNIRKSYAFQWEETRVPKVQNLLVMASGEG